MSHCLDTVALVLDNGSAVSKSGYAGDDAPRSVISSVTGKSMSMFEPMIGYPVPGRGNGTIGDQAQSKRGVLNITYPIENGIVTNWDDMETLWNYTFDNEMSVAPEEHPVLCTESALNPLHNREKMCEIMFERMNVPGFFVALQGVLTSYASGRGICLSVNCGDGAITVLPIYEGYCDRHAIQRIDLGGKDLTKWLAKMFRERGYWFSSTADMEVVREMKEHLCYTALDFDLQLKAAMCSSKDEKDYILPDGRSVTLNNERFRVPEVMFKPSFMGREHGGIQNAILDCMNSCTMDCRSMFYTQIVLSGGTTMSPGFPERLQKEIKSLIPQTKLCKVVSPPERKYSVWIGGSILASLSTFRNMWITKEQYDEQGPSIVHKKCI